MITLLETKYPIPSLSFYRHISSLNPFYLSTCHKINHNLGWMCERLWEWTASNHKMLTSFLHYRHNYDCHMEIKYHHHILFTPFPSNINHLSPHTLSHSLTHSHTLTRGSHNKGHTKYTHNSYKEVVLHQRSHIHILIVRRRI